MISQDSIIWNYSSMWAMIGKNQRLSGRDSGGGIGCEYICKEPG